MKLNHLLLVIVFASVAAVLVGHTTIGVNAVSGEHGSHEPDTQTKSAVLKTLDDYMFTFNAHDLRGWEETYQFPHYRLANGKMTVLDKAGLRDSEAVFGALQKTGWHHSKWEHRNIVHVSQDKVHVDTQFSRFDAKGTKIGVYESLYILTKENGRWGVKMRSSYAE
jgi:hypothetical protein